MHVGSERKLESQSCPRVPLHVLESGPAGRIVVFSATLSVTGVYVEG